MPDAPSTCALATAIAADPERRQAYQELVTLYGRLTNPVQDSLVDLLESASQSSCAPPAPHAFLSSSETPEVALFEELYPAGVPAGADLMGDLVDAIRAGRIDLTPASRDGWYQHQLFALETLLVTDKSEERAKIAFTARYKKRLREAFESMLVQHRETHVKQANEATFAAEVSFETPRFRVEPLATVYVRHARSYVFLEQALDVVLGAGVLDQARAFDDQGTVSDSVRIRIRQARDRFFGLYVMSMQDLGVLPKLDQPGDPTLAEAKDLAHRTDLWLSSLASDPVAKSDVRVMVPIASISETKTKYWAVVGVHGTLAGYSFVQGSDVRPPEPDEQTLTWLPTEQFVEVVSSSTPLDRDEFRSLCEKQRTLEAIRAALEAR